MTLQRSQVEDDRATSSTRGFVPSSALALVTRGLALGLLGTGCAQDLSAKGGDGKANAIEADAVVLDAKNSATFTYYDLDTARQVSPEMPDTDADWDLAASRYHIKINGGISGSQQVIVARLDGIDYDALSVAPETGYRSDQRDGDDEDDDEDLAFLVDGGWYSYDPSDHTLSPHPVIYVVRSTATRYYKLQILSYYDMGGDAGQLSFRFADITAPKQAPELLDRNAHQEDAGSLDPPSAATEDPTPDDNQEGDAGSDSTHAGAGSGCYDLGAHQCDCEIHEAACSESGGIWTGECACDDV